MSDENEGQGEEAPATAELSDQDLAQVTGGVAVAGLGSVKLSSAAANKAKTADKAFEAMDKFIRG